MSSIVRIPVGSTEVRDQPKTGSPLRSALIDTRDRELRDLRISVIDRCNFRCVYCMPKEVFGRDFAFMPKDQLLSFDEITRIVRIGVANGVEKVRLTGGEPLLRVGIEDLVARLAAIRTPSGNKLDLALTTNGSALAHKAQALKDAGLDRVTVSLDSLDEERFQAINDVGFPAAKVLHAIEVADEVGLGPIKVNMVVKRSANDQDILPMAEHFRNTPFVLRFIEYMDVGNTNGWKLDEVVPSAEIIARIGERYPLEPLPPRTVGETATRWRYADGAGEIGVISSVTHAFCGSCTRARISADGKLFTCLFACKGTDLRELLRSGADDGELESTLGRVWGARDDHYSEIRSTATSGLIHLPKIEMSYIGG